ncbi:hypothetical protein ABKV46_06310 [Enterobacter hormaechei]
MTNVSAVEKMAELMQQMEENSPRVATLQYCLTQVAEKVGEAEKRNAELEARCAALAAENAGLKAFGDKLDEMHNDLNGEGTGIQGRAEVTCQQVALEAAMEEFDAIKTTATDTFLAEVRAQAKADGVQEYADSFRHSASKIRECHGDTIRVRALLHEASNAEEFAAQLRKGVQS